MQHMYWDTDSLEGLVWRVPDEGRVVAEKPSSATLALTQRKLADLSFKYHSFSTLSSIRLPVHQPNSRTNALLYEHPILFLTLLT